MNTPQRHSMVAWFRRNDPYHHPIANSGKASETEDGFNRGAQHDVGTPPSDPDRDWVILVRKQ